MSHYYLRSTTDPLEVLAFGHAEAGRYQVPAGYEEAEGPLPTGYTMVTLPTTAELLDFVLNEAMTDDTPVALRASIRKVRLAVADAIKAGALDEARWLIDSFEAPADFDDAKDTLLAIIDEELGDE